MSNVTSAVHPSTNRIWPARFRWWHAALFWLLVNAPGWFIPWREDLFSGFRSPALRPPGEVFPIVWFVITLCALAAGLRILNDPALSRRWLHIRLQIGFWLCYLVFPVLFFGLSSPVAGLILTFAILVIAAVEVGLLAHDGTTSAWLLTPLLLWAAFAGLYLAPVQALWNPDPLFGLPATFR